MERFTILTVHGTAPETCQQCFRFKNPPELYKGLHCLTHSRTIENDTLHQVLQGKSKGLAWRDLQTTGNAQLATGELNSEHLHLIDETKGQHGDSPNPQVIPT